MVLETYRKKRNFSRTREPAGKKKRLRSSSELQFVIQKHAASHLHYDFRLELDGVLKSWAVPKGPHLDPAVKSLAVEVEDHPLEYAGFEGTIPAGEYGGGTVMVWDRGTWQTEDDPQKALSKGKLTFELDGEKLQGGWSLVRMRGKGNDEKKNWLLIKKQDEFAQSKKAGDILKEQPLSVLSGRDLDEIAAAANDNGKVNSKQKRTAKKSSNGKAARAKQSSRSKSRATSAAGAIEISARQLEHAQQSPLPKTFKPQLATLATEVPEGEGWLHEVKYDGYRLLAVLNHGKVSLLTRAGNDWTDRFPKLAEELEQLDVDSAILDGEVVILNRQGLSDFQRLQNWLKDKGSGQLAYFSFDLPYLNGYNLQQTPLEQRKELLEHLLSDHEENQRIVRYGGHLQGQGSAVVEQACKLRAEGIVSKRLSSSYQQRRSRDWLKIKCSLRQEFIIVGYTPPKGSRIGFGALLLAYYDGDRLVYCGRVGTGFNQKSLKQLAGKLKKLQLKSHPFESLPAQERSGKIHWVKPELVCEVQFTEWSDDGLLRHPSFQGLREDKPAREVRRESADASAPSPAANNSAGNSKMSDEKKPAGQTKRGRQPDQPVEVAGVRLTHPERVLYPEQGATKHDLALFYQDIADWVLPYLVDRPLTVVRCPAGRAKSCFYQKHLTSPMPKQVQGVKIKEKSKTDTYMVIKDLSGLIALVQMGVLEFHPWLARVDKLERPDQLVFDLDPGEGVTWDSILEAARLIHDQLAELELVSFVRTSGGKGLHVVVPLTRRNSWEELKDFAQALARGMERDAPDRYISKMTKAKRKGKVFVDYLRNQRGATAIASYSTRARADAPVATPLAWDELMPDIRPNTFNISNLRERLEKLTEDPWKEFFTVRQSLTKSILQSVTQ